MEEKKSSKLRRILKPSVTRKIFYDKLRIAEEVTTRHARRFVLRRLESIRDARRHIVLWVVVIGVLIGATGLQFIWYQQGYKEQAFRDGGIYAEASLGPVETLNPLFASSRAEESISRLVFSGLYKYDTSGQLIGDLAASTTITEGGTFYIVKLRSDALWHDGFRVTANDVAFTIDLLKDPNLRSTNPEDWRGIDVQVVDDETITFRTPSVIAAFSHALTFPVLPKHILYTVDAGSIRENAFSSSPVGSGVFKFKLLQDIGETLGHKVVYLERNPDYYGGVSKLDRFQVHVYSTQEAIIQALNSNEVNAAADLTIANVESLDKSKYDVESVPIKSGVYALFNTTRGALADKKVRQALRAGTDTAAIRNQLPLGKPSLHLPFINGQIVGAPTEPAYDLALANSLLDSAGWVLTDGVRKKGAETLQLTVVSTKDSNYERTFESLVGQWRALGVKVDTMILDLSGANQRGAQDIIQSRDYDAMLYQLTIGADLDVYSYWHSSQAKFGGLNLSNYSNQIADDALLSARTRLESDLRNVKYLTFLNQWIDDTPAIGLYQSTMYYAHSKKDRAFGESNSLVSSLDRYSDVKYWAVDSTRVYKTP